MRPALPDYQETIINVIHTPADERMAHIWTCNRRWITRLKKLGFSPLSAQNGGHWYAIPARAIWLKNPRPGRCSEARRAALVKANAAMAARRATNE